MKSIILLVSFMMLACRFGSAQKIPIGYLLQYQQNFNSGAALVDFKVENPSRWGIFMVKDNFYLQVDPADSITTIPSNIAILNNRIFGDFILEADIMPGLDSNGIREVCFFLGLRDLSRYYYVQLASKCDSTEHGIFLVRNAERRRLTGDVEKPVKWIQNKWHKIRLERNIVRRTIAIFLDDMTRPYMEIKDYELVMGSVGIGTVSAAGRFDNIKIWAPTVISE